MLTHFLHLNRGVWCQGRLIFLIGPSSLSHTPPPLSAQVSNSNTPPTATSPSDQCSATHDLHGAIRRTLAGKSFKTSRGIKSKILPKCTNESVHDVQSKWYKKGVSCGKCGEAFHVPKAMFADCILYFSGPACPALSLFAGSQGRYRIYMKRRLRV